MRSAKTLLISILAAFLATSPASALEVHNLGPASVVTDTIGVPFTIRLGLENASLDNVYGFEVTISGLAAASADVVSGMSATEYLCVVSVPGFGCGNGLPTIDNALFDPNRLYQNFVFGDDAVTVMAVSAALSSAASGAADLGVTNDVINATHDPVDAILTLTHTAPGIFDLTIGGTWSDGVNTHAIETSTLTLSSLPEPGTAVLLGLGLMGLATTRRL